MNNTTEKVLKAMEHEAEQRRREAQEQVNKPLPKSIKSILYTHVMYTFDVNLLPYILVHPKTLIELLFNRYGLRFQRPTYDTQALKHLGANTADSLPDETLLLITLQGGDPTFYFEYGRFPTGADSFVPIQSLRYSRENISVVVNGITDVAEAVIADVFEILWKSTGAQKKWNDKDVQSGLLLKFHSSSTKVDLGYDLKKLLNPNLTSFLDKNIRDGKGYGSKMTSYSKYDGFKPSSDVTALWTFDQLVFQVHCFNQTNGRQETAEVKFDTATKDERGRGIATVSTNLPFGIHADLVEELVTMLTEK